MPVAEDDVDDDDDANADDVADDGDLRWLPKILDSFVNYTQRAIAKRPPTVYDIYKGQSHKSCKYFFELVMSKKVEDRTAKVACSLFQRCAFKMQHKSN